MAGEAASLMWIAVLMVTIIVISIVVVIGISCNHGHQLKNVALLSGVVD